MSERIVNTTCAMDCPDTCTLEVVVAGDRIRLIRGAAHPTTNGFICDKVSRFARRVTHEDRLLHPLRRTGPKGTGQFARISWDDAVGNITDRFKTIVAEWGGEAILPFHYGGSNGLMSEEFLDDVYFARIGASRLAKTLCAAPATEVAQGMYGKMPGVAFEDYVHARFILIWGANPRVSNIHLVPFLRDARKRGAFIAVVDPVMTLSSQEVDLHLAVLPGSDLPIALAMIHLWNETGRLDHAFLNRHTRGLEPLLQQAALWPIERAAAEAGVSGHDIESLAFQFASSEPAVLRCGWGVERNRNGGQAIAAILAMPALLGKFGVPGGGYTLSNSGAVRLDKTRIFGPPNWHTRIINMTKLGHVLTGGVQPPVKGLFVYNCNPAVTVPDQNGVLRGLHREDLFTVVFDQVMTDTAKYADLVLPATTFLEHYDIKRSYGNYIAGGIQPAVPPAGEAKSNIEVFAALGQAMGWTDDDFHRDVQSHMRSLAEALTLQGRAAHSGTLMSGGPQDFDFPGKTPIQFQNVFPQTPDGKIHLSPSVLGSSPFQYHSTARDRYPLALISPATSKMISSTLGEFNYPELTLTLHPQDASRRGIADGDPVRVFNELGEVICRATTSERVRAGVALLPKGAWQKSSQNRSTSTALCPAHVNEVGGGACFNDARVEVTRA